MRFKCFVLLFSCHTVNIKFKASSVSAIQGTCPKILSKYIKIFRAIMARGLYVGGSLNVPINFKNLRKFNKDAYELNMSIFWRFCHLSISCDSSRFSFIWWFGVRAISSKLMMRKKNIFANSWCWWWLCEFFSVKAEWMSIAICIEINITFFSTAE